MNSSETTKQSWTKEYQRKGIPSSFRKGPSKTVVAFLDWLKQKEVPLDGAAADIGAGQGRNSFYLASEGFEVTSIDLLEENRNLIQAAAESNNLPIQAFAQDVSSNWPIENHLLSVAIDVFCYKHITNKEAQASYRKELYRSLKPGGYYFVSLASEKDGFYGPLLKDSKEKLIVDPYSKISSYLYSMEELVEEFSDFFEVVQIKEQTSSSPMYGKEYPRVVINAYFRPRPQD